MIKAIFCPAWATPGTGCLEPVSYTHLERAHSRRCRTMSVNKYLPHVLVLPEDDANRQLANGFHLDLFLATRRMQILEEAGGWQEVLPRFKTDHLPEMDRYGSRFMVLLIDFDGREDRLNSVSAAIPDRLQDRVFVLGVWSEPEELRLKLGSYETKMCIRDRSHIIMGCAS